MSTTNMNIYRKAFDLNPDEIYLNSANMGPMLRSAVAIGKTQLDQRMNPSTISGDSFFGPTDITRGLFNQLINGGEDERVIIAPSTSYVVSTVAQAIEVKAGSRIIITADQFPSNYYAWKRLAEEKGLDLVTVSRHQDEDYTSSIINQIDEHTAVVAIEPLNWGDGLLIDIDLIGKSARSVGALYLIDGTQYIGVYPYDQQVIQADVIVASTYKWMLSPYGIALAYIGSRLDDSRPLEDGWMNRIDSHDFQHLTQYKSEYRPMARRFEVGEAPDMIRIPILNESLRQILAWKPENIHRKIVQLVEQPNLVLEDMGFRLLRAENRCPHLYGLGLPDGLSLERVKQKLIAEKIFVSFRNSVIRVSPHVFNTDDEMTALVTALQALL